MTELLDADELAQRLHVGVDKARRLISSGQVPTVSFGRKKLVPADALHEFILNRTRYPSGRAEDEGDGEPLPPKGRAVGRPARARRRRRIPETPDVRGKDAEGSRAEAQS